MLQSYTQPYITLFPELRDYVHQVVWYGYAYAYDQMIVFLEVAARTSSGLAQEVARTPSLLDLFTDYLQTYILEHIDITKTSGIEQILKPERIGTEQDFFNWVEAGYSTLRTPKNYRKRLWYWQEVVWNDEELYHEVMNNRQQYVLYTESVPYWMIWNYGPLIIHNRPGFPVTRPLHFVEHALSVLTTYRASTQAEVSRAIELFLYEQRVPTFTKDLTYFSWPILFQEMKRLWTS